MMSFFQIGAENAKLQKLLEAFDSIKAKVSLFYILKKQTFSFIWLFKSTPNFKSQELLFRVPSARFCLRSHHGPKTCED